MSNQPRISVVICTYNRADLLEECLQSLEKQTVPQDQFEVLVVDNNSKDNTKEVTEKYFADRPFRYYVFEATQGLSYGRNTGWKSVNTPWVFYLDDDALAKENLIERIFWIIDNKGYEVFGGVYYPWYKYGRPVWYKDRYLTNQMPYKELHPMPKGESLSGCLMIFKKDLIEKYGGFSVDLGMNGEKIGYGEESVLQLDMQQDGIPLMYDPELVIYHLLPEYKANVEWFFKAAWAKGRDLIIGGTIKPNAWDLTKTFLLMWALLLVYFCKNTFKLITKKDYYFENWLIDTFKKTAKRIAVLYYGMTERYGNKTLLEE